MPADDPMNTPAMRQFSEIKKKYPDSIIFFRMGDFYEMFQEDAIIASSILDIALTKRQNQIPMCGIPYHATDSYLSRLINAGKRVVICEQSKSQDPNSKLMQRDVVRVMSPGTIVEDNLIKGYENNFLCFIYLFKENIISSLIDISTSEFYYSMYHKSEKININSLLKKFSPSELLVFKEQAISFENLELDFNPTLTLLDSTIIKLPQDSSREEMKRIIDSFLANSLRENSINLSLPIILDKDNFMELDTNTLKNLELIENQNINEKEHTLFSILNKCKTGGGKRLLKKNILFPFIKEDDIKNTWAKINKISSNNTIHKLIKEKLLEYPDIDRIINRFRVSGKALPRDFKSILQAIEVSFLLKKELQRIEYEFTISEKELTELEIFIKARLNEDELPAILGGDGIFLKFGFSEDLDNARLAKSKGKDWIIELEEQEKKRTGLNTLKIRYNKVVGYYIELSRKDSEHAPKDYFKKQTLVTSERYTTEKLEDIERSILSADDIILEIEKKEFNIMIENVLLNFNYLKELSYSINSLDYHSSLTSCKNDYNWIQPEINYKGELILENARHPVVEAYLTKESTFISNSVVLNTSDRAVAILTGPNMAGKSTFMRQTAICQILFQMGSFVPADKAILSICDRVFTRIGSADNLTAGESTFFLEMKESAHILLNRTENSLILFDEIGRGTSTYDGLSLAWAIIENLSNSTFDGNRTKTIFATHYHELTDLDRENGVFNLFMDTREKSGEIVFLKKVKSGKAKKSFGIYVARLAGIPSSIVDRSMEILNNLESKKRDIKIKAEAGPSLFQSISSPSPDLEKLKNLLDEIDPDNLTPKEALETIYMLKNYIKK